MENEKKMVFEPLKKKRGRPKKVQPTAVKPKGKRGRPKKQVDAITLQQPVAPKRKRGRPKKEQITAVKPKGKRGRPRKYYDITTNEMVTLKKNKEIKKSLSSIHESRENREMVDYIIRTVTNKFKAAVLKALIEN